MSATPGRPRTLPARFLDGLEEGVYRLNESGHWLFRLWDGGNELWARLVFRGVRHRSLREMDHPIRTRHGAEARLRMLGPADDEAFVALCAALRSRYRPPHPLDADGARRALRRRSYLPFGIFVSGRLVGYLLLRFFFPWRVVTGIWTLPETHNLGLGQECLRRTAALSRREGLADFATIPVDNPNSLRMANAAGWQVLRTNRRFHVLRWRPPAPP